jgi:hypothetical protein
MQGTYIGGDTYGAFREGIWARWRLPRRCVLAVRAGVFYRKNDFTIYTVPYRTYSFNVP